MSVAQSKIRKNPHFVCAASLLTRYIPATAICFPSDPWCPTYEKPNYDYDYSVEAGNETAGDGGDDYYGEDYYVEQAPVAPTVVEEPKMSDKTCELSSVPNVQYLPGLNGTATCTTINRCPNMVDNESAPQTHLIPCGFDEAEKLLMVCCPDEMVENPDDSLKQKPRFPKGSKRPRKCQDQSKLCRKWKTNGGCALDRDIIISEEDPWNGRVGSKVMFDFMQTACPQTCDLCGDKGCVDEHPRCQAWARAGYCVLAPFFMAHTCRYLSLSLSLFSVFCPSSLLTCSLNIVQGELWRVWVPFPDQQRESEERRSHLFRLHRGQFPLWKIQTTL